MRINLTGNKSFYVDFKYDDRPNQIGHTRLTTCVVRSVTDNSVIAQGTAGCYHKDVFDKERGRKTAMRRALEAFNLTKEEREQVWTAWHNRCPKEAAKPWKTKK